MKKYLISLAALLCPFGTWANGEIDIVKLLDGEPAAEYAGTADAVYNADTHRYILTVIPGEGNYVDTVYAVKKVDASYAQARPKAPTFNPDILVYKETPDADPSGETSYSLEMPDGGYDVQVTVAFRSRTSLDNATVTLSSYRFFYDGQPKTPDVESVTVGDFIIDPDTYTVTYSDNEQAGSATVTVTGQGKCTGSVTAHFDIVYNLTVNGNYVTRGNMLNILKDDATAPTVAYNGQGTLKLRHCTADITVVSGLATDLTVFLEGDDNRLLHIETTNANDKLIVSTDPSVPGTLVLGDKDSDQKAVSGFSDVLLDNGLAWFEGDLDTPYGEIGTPMKPITKKVEPKASDFDDLTIGYFNKIVDDVHYAFPITTEGNDNEDGFDNTLGGRPGIVFNTTMDDESLALALKETPGSPHYAELFTGATFKVPAGTGHILFDASGGGTLGVQIGNSCFYVFDNLNGQETIPYVLPEAAYAYFFNYSHSMARANRPPRAKIKPTTVKMHAFEAVPDEIQHLSDPSLVALDGKTINNLHNLTFAKGVYKLHDYEATALVSGLFRSASPARAIDLAETSITGVSVDRTADEFEGVADGTFIYMPVGNQAAEGEKNVVVGVVCNEMQLDDNNSGFFAARNFGATGATLMRDFVQDQTSTIFLPFAIDKETAAAMGAFYTFDKIEGDEAKLTLVEDDLAANTPYIFVKAGNGKIHTSNALVRQLPDDPGTTELIGTYENIEWTQALLDEYAANNEYIYGYAAFDQGDNIKAGEFVRVGAGATIKPYRAYLKIKQNAGARLKISWNGYSSPLGINNVTTTPAAKSWYTLSGSKLNGVPTKPGMYINNGKISVITK